MASTFGSRLKVGVETQNPFDPGSTNIYVSIVALAVISAVLMLALGFTVDAALWVNFCASSAVLIAGAWMLRRIGHSRAATGVEATTLVYLQGFVCMFLIYPLVVLGRPLADESLARADALLGFHWSAWYAFLSAHRSLVWPASIAYTSFEWQPLIVVPALVAYGLERRAWRFVLAANWALAITCLIFPFVPAAGAFPNAHLAASAGAVASPSVWHAATILHLIRDVGERHVSQHLVGALITFPSYHAAAALLYAWAVWPLRLLRWPLIVLNVGMALAAVPIGGHYVVDIIGGLVVAGAAIHLSGVAGRSIYAIPRR